MMNAIQKALSELRFRHNPDLLELIFVKRAKHYRATAGSLDEQIMSLVVRPRVLVDCDLIGGAEIFVNLSNLNPTRTNDYTQVYHIPKERTNGRSIISALNITFADPNRSSSYGASATQGSSAMLQLGQSMIDAQLPVPTSSTAYVQIIAENTVMVRDTAALPGNIFLRCIVGNDQNMSHLQLRSYRQFARMVELAVGSYMYNIYRVRMGETELYAGMDLGVIKEVFGELADYEELYQTFCEEKMEKVLFMNDRETYTRFLKSVVGGPH